MTDQDETDAPPLGDDGLSAVEARWVVVKGEYDEDGRARRAVTLLDEAVALGAPFDGFGLQVGLGVPLHDVDPTGLPTTEERQRLRGFERGLVQALGRQGRLVASLTADGLREYVAYVRSTDVLLPWRDAAPDGMHEHDFSVQVLQDPTWLGLRELAGLLQPGEELLGPLVELDGPA